MAKVVIPAKPGGWRHVLFGQIIDALTALRDNQLSQSGDADPSAERIPVRKQSFGVQVRARSMSGENPRGNVTVYGGNVILECGSQYSVSDTDLEITPTTPGQANDVYVYLSLGFRGSNNNPASASPWGDTVLPHVAYTNDDLPYHSKTIGYVYPLAKLRIEASGAVWLQQSYHASGDVLAPPGIHRDFAVWRTGASEVTVMPGEMWIDGALAYQSTGAVCSIDSVNYLTWCIGIAIDYSGGSPSCSILNSYQWPSISNVNDVVKLAEISMPAPNVLQWINNRGMLSLRGKNGPT